MDHLLQLNHQHLNTITLIGPFWWTSTVIISLFMVSGVLFNQTRIRTMTPVQRLSLSTLGAIFIVASTLFGFYLVGSVYLLKMDQLSILRTMGQDQSSGLPYDITMVGTLMATASLFLFLATWIVVWRSIARRGLPTRTGE